MRGCDGDKPGLAPRDGDEYADGGHDQHRRSGRRLGACISEDELSAARIKEHEHVARDASRIIRA
jgi:hypothetical protein